MAYFFTLFKIAAAIFILGVVYNLFIARQMQIEYKKELAKRLAGIEEEPKAEQNGYFTRNALCTEGAPTFVVVWEPTAPGDTSIKIVGITGGAPGAGDSRACPMLEYRR